ncbi:MAG: hypothetical protein RSD36_17475 [Terrisporobacter sp.]
MNDIGFVTAVKNISGILKQMWKFCCDTIEILSNPAQVLVGAMDLSHWILLIIAMVCLILTMSGCKKTKNGATISIIIYTILQCLASVLA